ncbi:hypothetical protein [Streptomyces sp. NPDC090021]|uniref:hypothetical protein n=1 Tax=Streptomyces sp. NPDC090021 TaxID=3365919 RepID=UPI0038102966
MPEHTMPVTDRRHVYVVKYVAGSVQPSDPLGVESIPEPGPALGRGDLGGKRALPAVEQHPLPRGEPTQRLRRDGTTAFAGGTSQFSMREAQVVQRHGLR